MKREEHEEENYNYNNDEDNENLKGVEKEKINNCDICCKDKSFEEYYVFKRGKQEMYSCVKCWENRKTQLVGESSWTWSYHTFPGPAYFTVNKEEEEEVYYQKYKCNKCGVITTNDDPDCRKCKKEYSMLAITDDTEEDEDPNAFECDDCNVKEETYKLCENVECERYPPDWDSEEDTEDTYQEGQWKKCCLCDGYFDDDGFGDILFIQEEPNYQEAECDLCGKTENIVQMKGSGQFLCESACDEDEDN